MEYIFIWENISYVWYNEGDENIYFFDWNIVFICNNDFDFDGVYFWLIVVFYKDLGWMEVGVLVWELIVGGDYGESW